MTLLNGFNGGGCVAKEIVIEPLTRKAFTPFGDVLDIVDSRPLMINRGVCARYSDLARLDLDADGRLGVSIFEAKAYTLPFRLEMLERHPEGSQAFLPTTQNPFLVIVAEDERGIPVNPRAFMTSPGQGINYHRGTWHGVLSPLEDSRFFVIDRIGDSANLEEYWFPAPPLVTHSTIRE